MWGGTGSDLVPSNPCPLLLERVPPQRRVWRGPLTVKTGLGPLGERVFPHPSGPLALPPSPWGKATSGGGRLPPAGEGDLRRGLSYFYSTVVTSVTVLAMVLNTL